MSHSTAKTMIALMGALTAVASVLALSSGARAEGDGGADNAGSPVMPLVRRAPLPRPADHSHDHRGYIYDSTYGFGYSDSQVGDQHIRIWHDGVGGRTIVPVVKPAHVRDCRNGVCSPKRFGKFLLWPNTDGTAEITDLNQNTVAIPAGSFVGGFTIVR